MEDVKDENKGLIVKGMMRSWLTGTEVNEGGYWDGPPSLVPET